MDKIKGLSKVDEKTKKQIKRLQEKLHFTEKLIIEQALQMYYDEVSKTVKLEGDQVVYSDRSLMTK